MASNLATIGFDIKDNQSLQDLVLRLADKATAGMSCPAGDYVIWRSRTGAEIWFHITPGAGEGENATREIVGLTPFFEGRSSVPLQITGRVNRPEDNSFEGAFCAWARPDMVPEDQSDDGIYPMVFDAMDFAVHAEHPLPAVCNARLTGFARELKAFPDEAAFAASQTSETPFAPQSFFPVGLFAASEKTTTTGESLPPSSNALIAGVVLEHHDLTNEETGGAFTWLLVESLGATYDIVAGPEVIKGEIRQGAIVQAACWMFGRILN